MAIIIAGSGKALRMQLADASDDDVARCLRDIIIVQCRLIEKLEERCRQLEERNATR